MPISKANLELLQHTIARVVREDDVKTVQSWCLGEPGVPTCTCGAGCSVSPAPDRAASLRAYLISYGYAVEWARSCREPVDVENASAFWTKARVNALSASLFAGGYSPLTARIIIVGVDRIIAATNPCASRRHIARILKRIPRTFDSQNRPCRVRDSRLLFELGIALMEEVIARGTRTIADAVDFRRGLEVATLALRPYRSHVFSTFKLRKEKMRATDNHVAYLTADGDGGYQMLVAERPRDVDEWVQQARSDARGVRPLSGGKHSPPVQSFPRELLDYLDRWLKVHRADLLQGRESNSLWVGMREPCLGVQALYDDVQAVCGDTSPKLFRHAFASSLNERDPGEASTAHAFLGNTETVMHASYAFRSSAALRAVGSDADRLLDALAGLNGTVSTG